MFVHCCCPWLDLSGELGGLTPPQETADPHWRPKISWGLMWTPLKDTQLQIMDKIVFHRCQNASAFCRTFLRLSTRVLPWTPLGTSASSVPYPCLQTPCKHFTFQHCCCSAVGLLLPSEQTIIESMKSSENKYFVPFVWATTIVERARKEGKIKEDVAVQQVHDVSISVRLLTRKWLHH